MKILSKKVKFFGRSIPAVAIALIAIAALASAGWLSYYGMLVGTAEVHQSVKLNGLECTGGNYENCKISYTVGSSAVAGSTYVDGPFNLKNDAQIPATVKFDTICSAYWQGGTDCNGITTTITTTITESSNYEDYFADSQRLVALKVSGLTLSDLLSKDLEYTVDVVSFPVGHNYEPNINIQIKKDGTIKTVENWGGFSAIGAHTKTFEQLMGESGGATVISGQDTNTRETFTTTAALLTAYGGWEVTMVEVRAQAGGAGGQVIRPVTFNAAGVTIDVPNSDSITGNIILQPGELLNFYIKNSFAINLVPDNYNITTTVVPIVPA
jgi:hypothetical protein